VDEKNNWTSVATLMTTGQKIFSLLLVTLCSCTKDKGKLPVLDKRDNVTGTYTGKCIHTFWNGTAFINDTSAISMTLTKSGDKVIDVIFAPGISNNNSFLYNSGSFVSLAGYHPPQLTKSKDSLYFYEKPALGPDWTNCMVKKK
jgi:hypothetical protein